jgi:hypothetical protein
MWITVIPLMGVSCIIDSIPGKMGLVGEKIVTINTLWGSALIQYQNFTEKPCPQVQDAECAGCGADTTFLCVKFSILS